MRRLYSILSFVSALSLVFLLGACEERKVDFSPGLAHNFTRPLDSGYLISVLNAQSDTSVFGYIFNNRQQYTSSLKTKYSIKTSDSISQTVSLNTQTIFVSEDAIVPYLKPCKDSMHLFLFSKENIAISDSVIECVENGFNIAIASEFANLGTNSCSNLVSGDCYDHTELVSQLNADSMKMSSVVTSSKKKYSVPSVLCSRYFNQSCVDDLFESFSAYGYAGKVVACADNKPIVISLEKKSNGASLTLISTPLLFSNLSVSYNHWANVPLVNELFHSAGFYSAEMGKTDRLDRKFRCFSPSPFYYGYTYKGEFKKIAPIKEKHEGSSSDYDFYKELVKRILFILVCVFSVFIIRRRQHSIPVFDGYRNRTADYVRQVGVLYYADGDFQLILKNKVVFFFSEVAERLHIQLSNTDLLDKQAAFLAAALGCPNLDLVPFLKKANMALDGNLEVNPDVLAEMSEKMNVIVKVLGGEPLLNQLVALFENKKK